MPGKTSVLIVDDHALFREGLKAIIASDGRFRVVAETGSAEQALELTDKHLPKVAILDICLPEKNGIALCREIRKRWPTVEILVVSMHSKIGYITKALDAGARGYVVKDSTSDMLLKGLEAVSKGELFIDQNLSYSILKDISQEYLQQLRLYDTPYAKLTRREQEVLRLLAEGMTTKSIAERLSISSKTVENHRGRLLGKLGLRGEIDLVRYAAKLGLLDLDGWEE